MFIEPDDLDFAADELYKLMTTGDNLLPGIENASRYFYSIEEIRITEQSGVYQVLARHLDEVGVLIKMTRQGDQFVFERMGSVL